MKPVKVWSSDRIKKKFLLAEDLNDVMTKGTVDHILILYFII